MSFTCTRCENEREGEPALVGPRSRVCAECVETRKRKIREAVQKNRAENKKVKKTLPPKKDGEFTCTRCGRPCFGEPALSGPQREVCQLCVQAAKDKHRTAARKSYQKTHPHVEEKERVCERCGTRHVIYWFRRQGGGRSRWCLDCEGTFGKPVSLRKLEERGQTSSELDAERDQMLIKSRQEQIAKRIALETWEAWKAAEQVETFFYLTRRRRVD